MDAAIAAPHRCKYVRRRRTESICVCFGSISVRDYYWNTELFVYNRFIEGREQIVAHDGMKCKRDQNNFYSGTGSISYCLVMLSRLQLSHLLKRVNCIRCTFRLV